MHKCHKTKKNCIFREIAAVGHLFWVDGRGFGEVNRSIPNRFDGKDVSDSDTEVGTDQLKIRYISVPISPSPLSVSKRKGVKAFFLEENKA